MTPLTHLVHKAEKTENFNYLTFIEISKTKTKIGPACTFRLRKKHGVLKRDVTNKQTK